MTKLFGRALFPLGFLLFSLVLCAVPLEALKSQSRRVRGSRILVDKNNNKYNEEDYYPRRHRVVDVVVDRSLSEVFKKDDKQKDNDKDAAVIESAFEETDEPTDPPKEEEDDEEEEEEEEDDKDDEEEETEEPTKAPKEEDEETEEPTDPPSPDDDDEEEDETTDDEEYVVDPEEQIDDMEEDGTETSEPVVLPAEPTGAPQVETPPTDESVVITNETDVWSVDLAPFTIEVDYDEAITEDPGVEEYLYMEMVRGGGVNLDQIDLEMTVATVYDKRERDRRHRQLMSQVLYYTGTATFEGPPVYETEKVHSLQNQILTNEERLSLVMAASLGEDPSNFTITSVTVEVTTDEVVQVDDGSDQQQPPEDPATVDDELSTTGLAIVLIAACIGAISLTIICLVAIKKPDKKIVEPYDGKRSMIRVSTKEPEPAPVPVPADDPDDKEGGKIDLNKTLDTEDDQVHEEFAQNMEKHSFDGSWSNKGPVTMQASVGRGSFHEVSENNDADQDSNSEDLKKELGQQLSDLQASVKAAREKTQKLLDEAKAS